MSALRIRTAEPEDVPVLLGLIRELAEYERLGHEVVATEDGLRAGLFGAQASAEALIAQVDGEVAGFALYFPTFSTFLARPGIWLEDLFVRPALRGKGYGRALLAHLAGLAAERGCGRLEWAVLDWNEPAQGFYRQFGAAPLADWSTWRLPIKP